MPYIPGYEEDGFLKSLDLTLEDIEPRANKCTEVYLLYYPTLFQQ